MYIEYAVGHRNGTWDGPFPTEEEMWEILYKVYGSPIGRIISDNRTGPWKDLDPVNGLCYAPAIYKKNN